MSDEKDKKKQILVIGHIGTGKAANATIAHLAAKLAQENFEVYGEEEFREISALEDPGSSEEAKMLEALSQEVREGRKHQAKMIKPPKQSQERWNMKRGGKKARMPRPR